MWIPILNEKLSKIDFRDVIFIIFHIDLYDACIVLKKKNYFHLLTID